ncbi:MAG: hypothetical protein ACRDI2_18310, partial [Chloroflexota bacterium]
LEQMQQVNQRLTEMVAAQSLSQASALLGKQIEAAGTTGEDGLPVSGEVTAVTLVDGRPMLTVGAARIALAEVTKVFPADEADETEGGT